MVEARLPKQSLSRANKSKQKQRPLLLSLQEAQGAHVSQRIACSLEKSGGCSRLSELSEVLLFKVATVIAMTNEEETLKVPPSSSGVTLQRFITIFNPLC